MLKTLTTTAWAALVLGLLIAGRVPAADIKLAELRAAGPGTSKLQILARAEPQFLESAASAVTWILQPAGAVSTSVRPDDRLIDLYTGTAAAPILLCRILVRYYPIAAGWAPYFQLNEEPLVMRVNGRWQPVELTPGTPILIAQKGNTVPTPEGFFPSLEFGLTVGALPIVGWRVR